MPLHDPAGELGSEEGRVGAPDGAHRTCDRQQRARTAPGERGGAEHAHRKARRAGEVPDQLVEAERAEPPGVHAVQLDSPFSLPPDVAEELPVRPAVQVRGAERPVEHAGHARGAQPVPEVEVRMVEDPVLARGEAGAQAVGAAHRQVAAPQAVEDVELAALDARDVAQVLGGVEARPEARGRPGLLADGHEPHDDEPTDAVVGQVPGDGPGSGDHVVVEEDDHLPRCCADAGLEGAEVAAVTTEHRAQPRAGGRELAQHARGLGVRPVEDDHDLEGRGVGEHGVDEALEALGTAERGDDDRRPIAAVGIAQSVSGGLEFVAWGAVPGRSEELAAALGGQARCFFPPHEPRPPVLVRWAISSLRTAVHVLRRRPGVLVVTNPPCPAALVGLAAGRAVGAVVVLDSHPGAFGAQGDRVAARLAPLHRWATRHADLSIVAAESWREVVERWGAGAVVVHEAPGGWELRPAKRHDRLRVLYVGRFARDEPWEAVLGAAHTVPGVDVLVTGDPTAVALDAASLPDNVELLGYLARDAYRRAVYGADAVVALTTDGGSVMRAACEAVWAGRPLVVSGWPTGREAFPFALHVDNTPESIAAALRDLDADYGSFAGAGAAAHALQLERWGDQRRELLDRISSAATGGGRRRT